MYLILATIAKGVRKYFLPFLILVSSALGIFSATFGQSIVELLADRPVDLNRIHYTLMAFPIVGLAACYLTFWIQRERYKNKANQIAAKEVLKDRRVANLEHDLVHMLRDSCACIEVLSLNNALSRDQFDNELDKCIDIFCETTSELFYLITGCQSSTAIHLIDHDDKFSFQSRDSISAKERRSGKGGQLEAEQLSTGMIEILESAQPFKAIKFYPSAKSKMSDYQDATAQDHTALYSSTVVVAAQLVLKTFVRRRHEPLFTESPRIVAGFLTLESKDENFSRKVPKQLASRLADTLFLGLELFASAEIRQFGPENCTMGRISDGLFKPELTVVGGTMSNHPSSTPK